jgi:hypothetical protein
MKAPDVIMFEIRAAIDGATLAILFAPGMPLLPPEGKHRVEEALETLATRVVDLLRNERAKPEATDGN